MGLSSLAIALMAGSAHADKVDVHCFDTSVEAMVFLSDVEQTENLNRAEDDAEIERLSGLVDNAGSIEGYSKNAHRSYVTDPRTGETWARITPWHRASPKSTATYTTHESGRTDRVEVAREDRGSVTIFPTVMVPITHDPPNFRGDKINNQEDTP